jgi:thiamine-phosphate pyrophosphorylase
MSSRVRHRLPALFLLTDDDRVADWPEAVRCLPRYAGLIIRSRDPEVRRKLAFALTPLARRRGICVLIAGDLALAAHIHADGLHASEAMVSSLPNWRKYNPAWILTAAAHSAKAIAHARWAGADACFLSPVFPTESHPGVAPLDILKWQVLSRDTNIPIFALGGIAANNVTRLLSTRAAGLALVGGSLRSSNLDGS